MVPCGSMQGIRSSATLPISLQPCAEGGKGVARPLKNPAHHQGEFSASRTTNRHNTRKLDTCNHRAMLPMRPGPHPHTSTQHPIPLRALVALGRTGWAFASLRFTLLHHATRRKPKRNQPAQPSTRSASLCRGQTRTTRFHPSMARI